MVTVFTPTYNRRYTIENLYKSLLAQSDMDFEWLVVDDGSTDDTENFFRNLLQKNSPFKIRYFKQSNGGKHRAINLGVQEACGELFFIVDSDDTVTSDAMGEIKKMVGTIACDNSFAGIAGLKAFPSRAVIGGVGKGEFIDATNIERKNKNLLGDKAEVYYTAVLKKYPFPEFEGETFMTEEVVWNRIAADGYRLRWFSNIIYIAEYLPDGLTNNESKYANSPRGTLLWARMQLELFRCDLRTRLSAIKRYYLAVRTKKRFGEIAADLKVSRLTLLMVKVMSAIKRRGD